MVALPPTSESPTHDLARRLHAVHAKPTSHQLQTALALQSATCSGNIAHASVDSIAVTINASRAIVMRCIKLMRRRRLIAAEFFGLGEGIEVIITSTDDEDEIPDYITGLIDLFHDGEAEEGLAA